MSLSMPTTTRPLPEKNLTVSAPIKPAEPVTIATSISREPRRSAAGAGGEPPSSRPDGRGVPRGSVPCDRVLDPILQTCRGFETELAQRSCGIEHSSWLSIGLGGIPGDLAAEPGESANHVHQLSNGN